ncbi:hypothetical protein D3C87_1878020 [compost metagenome]
MKLLGFLFGRNNGLEQMPTLEDVELHGSDHLGTQNLGLDGGHFFGQVGVQMGEV